jgi:hypothetical protein
MSRGERPRSIAVAAKSRDGEFERSEPRIELLHHGCLAEPLGKAQGRRQEHDGGAEKDVLKEAVCHVSLRLVEFPDRPFQQHD